MSRERVGYTSPHHEGAWSSAKNYTPLSVVTNSGSSYMAKKAVPAGTALNNSVYWGLLASVGSDPNITITKTGTSGLVDTYTWTDSTSGNTGTFTVTNGQDGDVTADVIATPYDNTVAYKIGNLLTYLGKQYEVTGDDGVAPPIGTLPTDTDYFTERPVSEIIEMIKTGEITVGKANLANNFDSKMVLTDNSGYLYRTTGGSLEVGEQNRVKKIVGASVPIIQLVKNPNFASTSNWAPYSSSITSLSVANNVATMTFLQETAYAYNAGLKQVLNNAPVVGHKYLVVADIYSSISARFGFDVFGQGRVGKDVTANQWKQVYLILSADSTNTTFLIEPQSNLSSFIADTTYKVKNAMLVDLTATFGTTVANHLYALEQAQAGTGIAKAKEILVKDYYPYNVTAFTHTKTSGKVNNGFNQWDGEWSGDGAYAYSSFIKVFPDTTYYIRANSHYVTLYFYGEDKTQNADPKSNAQDNTFTTNSQCVYVRFSIAKEYVTDVCINLHWDGERDGEYEPYQEWNYPVQDIELKGILSLDAQDNWVADGDEYLPSGEIVAKDTLYDFNEIPTNRVSKWSGNNWVMTGRYISQVLRTVNVPSVVSAIQISGGDYPNLLQIITSESYADATEFLSVMANCKILAKLVTEETSSADSYTELQNDSNWGTEKWIDNRDVPLPVFSTCEYIPDLKAKVETAPESPDEDGDYIMHRENGLNSYGSLSTWLSANGYNKLQDLSSGITDSAGLTYAAKRCYATGKVVTLYVRATNGTGSAISANATLFDVPSAISIGSSLYAVGYAGLSVTGNSKIVINGTRVYCESAIANGEAITFTLTYCIA